MLNQIIKYFKKHGLPSGIVTIYPGVTVHPDNAKMFLNNTIDTIRKHPGNERYLVYLDHLKSYYRVIKDAREQNGGNSSIKVNESKKQQPNEL